MTTLDLLGALWAEALPYMLAPLVVIGLVALSLWCVRQLKRGLGFFGGVR